MALINKVIEGARSDGRFLASLATNHEARLLESIRTLRENILTSMSKLETTPAGKLLGVKVNLKQSQQIHRQLVNQFEKDYNVKVNTMLGDFSGIDKMITRRYKGLNEAIQFTSIDKVMTDTLKLSTYGRYRAFGEDARNRIASVMYNSVAGGAKMSTLVNTIRGVLTGHRDARGRPMTMYAQGFAQDAVMNYHNQVNTKKGEDLGMKDFLYYGDIIDTSRPFCITRVGKVYTKRQIMAWDSLSWKGKAGPPFAERGGYNCRHHWRPVRPEWIQDEKGKQLSRNEVLGEMAAVDKNVKARNLSSKISTKRLLLEQLEEREELLRTKAVATPLAKKESAEALLLNIQERVALEKEIVILRDRLAKIGGTVKPKVPPIVKPKPPVVKPTPPIAKPKKKPKVKKPKVATGGGTVILPSDPDELYLIAKHKITELEEVIELTPLARATSFEEFFTITARRLQLLEEIEGVNARLVALGHTAVPIPASIKKIIPIVPKPVPGPVVVPIKPSNKAMLTNKLSGEGIQGVVDLGSNKFSEKEWIDNILQPLSDEVDRLTKMSYLLEEGLQNAPLRRLELYKGTDLAQAGSPQANGVYWGYNSRMALASSTDKALREIEKKLVIGESRWSVTDAAQSSISTFRHELGHHVQNMLDLHPTWDAMNMRVEWDYIWGEKGSSWFQKHVTIYSGTNNHEAFAESFAAYTSKMYKRGMLPKEVETFMDSLFTGMRGKYNFIQDHIMPYTSADIAVKIVRTEKVFKPISKPMASLNKMSGYTRYNGIWYLEGKKVKSSVAKKLNKMTIPPAWTDVVVSTSKKDKVQAMGRDAAGRWQYKYSAKHTKTAAKKKFTRIKEFKKSMPRIRKKIEVGIKKGEDLAYLLELENRTAIRIGTDRDLGAKFKAYGLTTLQYEHVVIKGNKIILDFTAKKGIHAHYELTDKRLASWLKKKKRATRKGQKLFPDMTSKDLNKYIKKVSGKSYTAKDFRTYHATRIANDELEKYAGKVLTAKEKKSVIKDVSEKVGKFLSNTATMAKNSYIDPMVWEYIGGL